MKYLLKHSFLVQAIILEVNNENIRLILRHFDMLSAQNLENCDFVGPALQLIQSFKTNSTSS